jgi:multiple sugar transport system substrate-binding protein
MRKNRNIWRGFLILMLLVTLLMTSTTIGNTKIKIRYSSWGDPAELELNKRIIAAFEAKNPDIEVEFIPIVENYEDKITAMYVAGNEPDVMYTSPTRAYDLFKSGLIEPLDSFFKAEPQWLDDSKYFTRAYIPYTDRETRQIYATVNGTNTWAVFYNKDMFTKAGLPYPNQYDEKNNWTWSTFLTVTRKLTKDLNGDGKIDQWGTQVQNTARFWMAFIWQNGGDLFNKSLTEITIDQPKAVEALQFIQDLVYKYQVAPTPAQLESIGAAQVPRGFGLFTNRVATCIWQTYIVQDAKMIKDFKWDMAHLPKKVTRACAISGGAYRISSRSKNKEAAWRFAKFFQEPEAQRMIAEAGLITPFDRSIAYSDIFLKSPGAPEHHQVRLEAIEYGRPAEYQHKNYSKIVDIATQEIDLMLLGKQDAKETARKIKLRTASLMQ